VLLSFKDAAILKTPAKKRQHGKAVLKTVNKTVLKTASLHPRNPHGGRYDLHALSKTCPELKAYLRPNPKGDNTIDFSDEMAVLCLNKALLAHYYQVENWQIPAGYLCPPIPGRADYIHYLADLLADCRQYDPNDMPAKDKSGNVPTGKQVKVLDIGTGANCIYPIIGSQSYGWQFVATDIDPVSVKAATVIVQSNTCLTKLIRLQHQIDSQAILKGMITDKDRFDLTLCNPPFHASMAEAQASSQRKWQNLSKGRSGKKRDKAAYKGREVAVNKGEVKLNFGGQQAELWCTGGEVSFLKRMAKESMDFAEQVCWFSSLVSKEDNVRPIKKLLSQLGAHQIKVVKMSQGQKISRLIAWSFLTAEQQKNWALERWS